MVCSGRHILYSMQSPNGNSKPFIFLVSLLWRNLERPRKKYYGYEKYKWLEQSDSTSSWCRLGPDQSFHCSVSFPDCGLLGLARETAGSTGRLTTLLVDFNIWLTSWYAIESHRFELWGGRDTRQKGQYGLLVKQDDNIHI